MEVEGTEVSGGAELGVIPSPSSVSLTDVDGAAEDARVIEVEGWAVLGLLGTLLRDRSTATDDRSRFLLDTG